MIFCVPVWRDVEGFRRRTLALLQRAGVEPPGVRIAVGEPEQLNEYRAAFPEWAASMVLTMPGLARSRMMLERTLPEGERVVWVNDDVKRLRALGPDGELFDVDADLAAFCSLGFDEARRHGARLWGVYPIANAYFMRRQLRVGLSHIVGSFYGVELTRDPHLRVITTGDAKEDYERSLRFGRAVRFDGVGVDTIYYNKGRFEDRTSDTVEAQVRRLETRWPDEVKRNARRKSAYPEILLRGARPELIPWPTEETT